MEDLIARIKRRSSTSAKSDEMKGGIHGNMELTSFRGAAEKLGDYNRYLNMKFKKINSKGEALGEFSTSFTELDIHSEYLDFKIKMLLKQTHNLAVAMYGDDWRDEYDPLKGLLKEEKDAEYVNVVPKYNSNKFLRALEKNVIAQVTAFTEKFMQSNGEKKFQIKLVYNDKGYVNIPAGDFIVSQDAPATELVMNDKEKGLIKKYK